MRIKKYEAYDMKEAMKLIKDELGPDALILSSRKVMKNNNLGLFSRPIIEVTAAIEEDDRIKGKKTVGQNYVYISTNFSQLGDTFIIIRNMNNINDVVVKTEVDISEQLKALSLENTRISWVKYNPKDLEHIDIKKELTENIGNFEVII